MAGSSTTPSVACISYGIGALKVHLHRAIKGTPKALTVTRQGRRWWVSFRCVGVPAQELPATGRDVGIDLGVSVLVATSDEALTTNDAPGKRAAGRLAAAQRALATKKRGSNRRKQAVERVAEHHRRVRDRRRDVLHHVSRTLVDRYDSIVGEALLISNMVRRPGPRRHAEGGYDPNGASAKGGLNRSIYDAGWGTLVDMIAYKAEDAGRTFIQVDPRNTSRRCALCGHLAEGNRRGQRFSCLSCGHEAHADVNAAVNILRAGRAQQRLAA